MDTKPKSKEIRITRVYDASVQIVWEAWTDPQRAAHWWGPRGFTITTHSKDFRVGGTWVYTMHGPNGMDFPNKSQYLEIEQGSRMVYDHWGNEQSRALFRVTVQFTDVKGKTKMDMVMAFPTSEAAEATKVFIKKAGGNATWDRLAEYLEKQASNKEVFVINRSFDVPIETLFDLWTDPKLFTQWLPPTGFTMRFIKVDVREGGEGFYEMTDGGKTTMFGRVKYRDIRRPSKIVYTQEFSDKDGNISRHPMAPTWPETMLTTVSLTEEGADHSRATVTWEVFGKATPEEVNTFSRARAGMTQGWTGSFDKLENDLANSHAQSRTSKDGA
jgi:uncharacterized protein YndB with AHSA1/START domain